MLKNSSIRLTAGLTAVKRKARGAVCGTAGGLEVKLRRQLNDAVALLLRNGSEVRVDELVLAQIRGRITRQDRMQRDVGVPGIDALLMLTSVPGIL